MPRTRSRVLLALKPKIKLDFITAEVKLSSRELAQKYRDRGFDISKSVIADWIKNENWEQLRIDTQNSLAEKVTKKIVDAKARAKAKMIKNAEMLSSAVLDALMNRIKKSKDGEIFLSVKDYVAIQKLVAELRGILASHGSGTQKQIVFNINVPVEYLTPEGRDWLRKKMQDPTSLEQQEPSKTIMLDESEYEIKDKE